MGCANKMTREPFRNAGILGFELLNCGNNRTPPPPPPPSSLLWKPTGELFNISPIHRISCCAAIKGFTFHSLSSNALWDEILLSSSEKLFFAPFVSLWSQTYWCYFIFLIKYPWRIHSFPILFVPTQIGKHWSTSTWEIRTKRSRWLTD